VIGRSDGASAMLSAVARRRFDLRLFLVSLGAAIGLLLVLYAFANTKTGI
jgi:hypothetical protein